MEFEEVSFSGVDLLLSKLASHPQLISYPNITESNKCKNRSRKEISNL